MKMLIAATVALAATCTTGLAIAADAKAADKAQAPATTEAAAKSPQQQKMKQCNADARGKKGDERKAFMKACLSKKGEAAAS